MLPAIPAWLLPAFGRQGRGRRAGLADDSALQESPAAQFDTMSLDACPWEAGTGSWQCVWAVPFLWRVGRVPVQYEKQK